MRRGASTLAPALAGRSLRRACGRATSVRVLALLSCGALALALALVAVPPASAHAPPAQAQPYSVSPVGGGCAELAGHPCPQVPSSGVQFGPFDAAPRALDLRIDDALGERIGASFALYDASGVVLKTGTMCGAVSKVPAPAGTAFVTVTLDSPANLGHHCGLAPRYPTVGNVLLRLRGETSAQVDDAA